MGQIASITIRGVRGIRDEVVLPLDGESLVLLGDNGTGKSSIAHGLAWALTGRGDPAGDAAESSYYRHVLESSARVVIELAPKGRIEVTDSGITTDEGGAAFRAACIRSNPFLRRPDLLKFLDAKPGERFSYLESFLDLDVADAVREAIGSRAKAHEDDAKHKRKELDALLEKASGPLPAAHRKVKSWQELLGAFAEWASELGIAAGAGRWEDLEAEAHKLAALLADDALGKRRRDLTTSLARLDALVLPEDPCPIIELVAAFEAATEAASLETLLEAADNALAASTDAATCPVCEQPVEREALLGTLRQRRADLKQLSLARKLAGTVGDQWRFFAVEADSILSGIRALLPAGDAAAPFGMSMMPPNVNASAPGRVAVEQMVRHHGADLRAKAAEQVGALRKTIASTLERIPNEERAESLRAFVRAVRHAAEHRLPIEMTAVDCETRAKSAARLKMLADAIRKARQDVARDLLHEISKLVAELYRSIHPPDASDEATGAPSIDIQRHGKGTAFVRGQFQDKEIEDPRWVYSDGHLDTVGICVFLALRLFRAGRDKAKDPKLMVLDDIVLSIDLRHARRLLEVVRERFKDHQVIFLTHNRLFVDWCRKYLPMYRHRFISRWSLQGGPSLGTHATAIEHLRSSMDAETTPKLLAQAVMNLLDEWLADARFAYSLAVPAKYGDEYTLTDLWNPFRKKLLDVTKKVPVGQVREVLQRLHDVEVLRNRLGAHENASAREYPLEPVREIARDVLTIVEALHCSSCNMFATAVPKIDDPEILRCKCEALRYIRPPKSQAKRPE